MNTHDAIGKELDSAFSRALQAAEDELIAPFNGSIDDLPLPLRRMLPLLLSWNERRELGLPPAEAQTTDPTPSEDLSPPESASDGVAYDPASAEGAPLAAESLPRTPPGAESNENQASASTIDELGDASTPAPHTDAPSAPHSADSIPSPDGGLPADSAPSPFVEQKVVTLPNARVGEKYEAELDIPDLRIESFDDGRSSLQWEGLKVGGVPTQSGDFELRFEGKIEGRRTVVTARLAVIPDPKSLWVTVPSDQTGPFAKADQATAFLRSDDLVCAGASKRGRSHAMTGAFRDDDFEVRVPEGGAGWHVVAVADGAGSAPYSRRGSRIAVESVIDELPGRLEEQFDEFLPGLVSQPSEDPNALRGIQVKLYSCLGNAAWNAAKKVEALVGPNDETGEAFSTTLIICVARRLANDRWFTAGFSIGDGGAAVLDLEGGRVFRLTEADSGEYAGQTRFLRTAEFGDPATTMKRIHFEVLPRFTAILAMTDGVSDAKLPTEVDFGDVDRWRDLWQNDLASAVDIRSGDAAEQLLTWLDFWSPGNHDDRTLVILAPHGVEE